MKIAYIISAYKYPEQLTRLVLKLNSQSNYFFIHFDKKSDDQLYYQITISLSHLPNVYFLERHNCYWGDFGHVRATLKGIKKLFRLKIDFDWLVLLTGQDYPIKSNSQIEKFLQENEEKLFIQHDEDYLAPPDPKWPTSGSDRTDYWHFHFPLINFIFPASLTRNSCNRYRRRRKLWFWIFWLLWLGLVSWLPIKRKFPEGFKPFRGSPYWCLNRSCVEYIYNFVEENPAFVKFFEYVDIPDEMFFQTIILNSHFKDQVVNDNLFYIDWENPNPLSPRNFVKIDFEKISSSSKLFARKFDATRDVSILNMIDHQILTDNYHTPGKMMEKY